MFYFTIRKLMYPALYFAFFLFEIDEPALLSHLGMKIDLDPDAAQNKRYSFSFMFIIEC